MKPAPSVSVVTVSLNAEKQIAQTIASVLSQKDSAVEYVLIDGGSTDKTLEILKRHDARFDHLVSEPDQGVSQAFNKGISAARGEIVGILNAGDWYEPNTLRTVADVFKLNPDVDVVCGSLEFWDGDTPHLHCFSNPEGLDKETSVYHPTVFVRKSAYIKYGMFDESYRYAMDYELLLRFKRQGAKFLSLERTLANMSLDGLSYRNWYRGLKEVERARSQYYPPYNVAFFHLIAVFKNVVARFVARLGLRSMYQAYWKSRNRKIVGMVK